VDCPDFDFSSFFFFFFPICDHLVINEFILRGGCQISPLPCQQPLPLKNPPPPVESHVIICLLHGVVLILTFGYFPCVFFFFCVVHVIHYSLLLFTESSPLWVTNIFLVIPNGFMLICVIFFWISMSVPLSLFFPLVYLTKLSFAPNVIQGPLVATNVPSLQYQAALQGNHHNSPLRGGHHHLH